MFKILFTITADKEYSSVKANPANKGLAKQIGKTLGYLANNPKHPSLNTHPFESIGNPINPKEKVFESYAQNNTPSAYRIFWYYGPNKQEITIIAITPHP